MSTTTVRPLATGNEHAVSGAPETSKYIGYKHVPLRFADAFAKGEDIAVGTFEYYRGLEGDRADPMEGRAEFEQVTGQLIPYRADDRLVEGALALGILIEPDCGNTYLVGNRSTSTVPPAYLFCVSTKPDWSRVENEAIFKIPDLAAFGEVLRNTQPDMLGEPVVGPVRYVAKSGDPFNHPVGRGPFDKSVALQFEREVRIMWPTSTLGRDWRLIRAPECSSMMVQVYPPA